MSRPAARFASCLVLLGALPGGAGAASTAPAGPPADADFAALLEFLGESGAAEQGWDEFIESLPDQPGEMPPVVDKTDARQ